MSLGTGVLQIGPWQIDIEYRSTSRVFCITFTRGYFQYAQQITAEFAARGARTQLHTMMKHYFEYAMRKYDVEYAQAVSIGFNPSATAVSFNRSDFHVAVDYAAVPVRYEVPGSPKWFE